MLQLKHWFNTGPKDIGAYAPNIGANFICNVWVDRQSLFYKFFSHYENGTTEEVEGIVYQFNYVHSKHGRGLS